jgi:arylsulfatase A-like enzyme
VTHLLLIVADCANLASFPGGKNPDSRMLTVDQLRRSSTTYSRAVSAGNWTLPAHASLFTGLYPWEHEFHSLAHHKMPTTYPTLAERLSDLGLRTASFSANPFLSPRTGLIRGFDESYWGDWNEGFLRGRRIDRPPHSCARGTASASIDVPNVPPARSAWEKRRRQWGLRFPFVTDLAVRARRMGSPSTVGPLAVADWIGPAISEWLDRIPDGVGSFCFVNLLEAHEPYFGLPWSHGGFGRWLTLMRSRQDTYANSSPVLPTPRQLEALEELYDESIRALDRHIANLLEVYQAAGVWGDTTFVLTSDHGQSFGAGGAIHHGVSLSDPTIRVPLLVRPPGGGAEAQEDSWVSTRAVFDLLMRATSPAKGVFANLQSGTGTADEPVYSFDDSVNPNWVHGVDAQRARAGRYLVAGYRDDLKAMVGTEPTDISVQRVAAEGTEAANLWDPSNAEHAQLVAGIRRIVDRVSNRYNSLHVDSVSSRLESWGYD